MIDIEKVADVIEQSLLDFPNYRDYSHEATAATKEVLRQLVEMEWPEYNYPTLPFVPSEMAKAMLKQIAEGLE